MACSLRVMNQLMERFQNLERVSNTSESMELAPHSVSDHLPLLEVSYF